MKDILKLKMLKVE